MTIQEILQEIKKIADNNSFVNFSYIGDVEEMKLQPGFEYPGFAVQNYSYDEETKTYYLSLYLISEDRTLENNCLNVLNDIVYNINLKHLDLGIVIKSDNIQLIQAGNLNGTYCSMQLQMTITSCVCEDKPGYVSSVNGQTGDVIIDIPEIKQTVIDVNGQTGHVILDIPKKVSDLENDSDFIDSEYVDNLIEQLNSSVNTNYAKKSELSDAISEEVLRSDNKYAEKTELDNYVTNSSVSINYLKKTDYVEPDVNLNYVNDKFNTLNSSINEHFQVKGDYATETYVDGKIETLNSSIVQNYIKKGEVPEDVYSKTEVDELFTEYGESVESTYTKKDYLETRISDISSAIDDGIVSANEYTNGQIETVESDFSTKLNNVNSSVNNEFNRVWEKENTQDSEISNINNFISSVPDNYVLITYYNEDKENIKAEINSVDTKIDNINSSTAEAFETVTGQISNISERVSTIEDDYVKHEEITDFVTNTSVYTNYVQKSELDELKLFKFPNVTIIGEPTINNGQISDFSENNYLLFPFMVNLKDRVFEINFEVTTGSDVITQQNILDSEYCLAFAIRDSKFILALSTNGTSWDLGEIIGSSIVLPNRTYRIKISYDRMTYKVFYSIDGGNEYILDAQKVVSEQSPYPKQMYIGVGGVYGTSSKNVFSGIINLNYANLKINGELVWQGMDEVGLATRLAVDMSNIDPAGEQKVKDIISTEGYIKEIPPLTDYVTKEYLQNVYDSSFYDKIGNGPYLKGNSGILNITVYDKILYNCEEITITATYQSLPFQGTVYQNNGLKITNLAQPGETQDFYKNIGLLINNNFGNIKYITPGETLSFTAEETKTFTNIQFINYGFDAYGDGHVLLEQLGNVYDSLNDWLNSKQYINKSYAERFITNNLFTVALDEINENINAVSTKIDDVSLRTDSSILILNSSVNKIEKAGFVTGTYISDNYYNKTEIDDKGYLDKTTADIYYQEKGNYVDEIAYSNKVSEIDSSISDISTRLAGIKISTDYVKTADYSADKEAQATKDSEQDSNIATANLNISQVDAKVDNINSSTAEQIGSLTGQISNISGRVQTIEDDYVKHDEIEHFVTDSSVADNYARKSSLEGLITEADADNKYYGKTAGEGLYNYVHTELDREITDLHNKDLEIDSSISDVSARLKTVKDTVNGLDNIYVKSETYNIDKNTQAEVNQDVTTKLGKINTAIGTLNSSVNEIENTGYATQTWVSSQGYLNAVDKTELEGKINGKQDAGDYATNTRVNEVEGKIPEVKDFVTNSSISTNYYNKTEIDNKDYLNKVTADGYYQEKGNYINETVYSNKVSEIDSSISDISARLKTANDNIANKADQSELANYYTNSKGTALEGRVSSAEQNITGLQEDVQTLDSKITNNYVSNSSISTNYYMKKDVYNKQETENIVEILRTDISNTYEQKGHYDSAISTLNSSVNKVETNIRKKQDKLVSGTNIKTINNESILGNGNIEIKGKEHVSLTYAEWEALSYDEQMADKVYLIKDAENVYQAPLVSGTNIKTINGNSILGEGNIEIQGGGGGGGTSEHQNITQAEYDALTPEQKQADIVYFITDADVVYATTAYVDEKIGNINTILESI